MRSYRMTDLRPMSVAGTWYPAAADRLECEVARYLEGASIDDVAPPVAIIAPHAGLKYSGPVAAFAYQALEDARYSSIVLVGPSHFVGFRGVSIWPSGAWQTPFGPVQVDEKLAQAMRTASAEVAGAPISRITRMRARRRRWMASFCSMSSSSMPTV